MGPRTILITGANRGIGLEFVRQLVRMPSPPVHLFATCRDPSKAENLNAIANDYPSVKVLKLDVNDLNNLQQVKETIESILQFQGLNCLINNGAIHIRKGLADVTADDMMENYRTNVVGPLVTVKTFLPLLRTAAEKNNSKSVCWERAAVFNLSSILGSIEENTSGGLYPYRATKTALNQITRSLCVELEKEGILVASFHPGWVQTDMGGPTAKVTTEQSVQGMLQVFPTVDDTNKGRMLDFTGKIIPW